MSGSLNAIDAADLLVSLVRIPSPSGSEAEVAHFLADWARERGLEVSVDDAAVRITVPGRGPGPTLLFASHLDTVPPGESWSIDPYEGVVEDGALIGRGAVDAKASVAAMASAAAMLRTEGEGPARGRLVVLATYSEETRDTSMPLALERLDAPPDAAVVGEPTSLEPCIAQRGLLILRLIWRGEQRHAALSEEGTNAILEAGADLVALAKIRFDREHPLLGGITVTPTEIHAGVARNVTPPACEAILDIRTTPAWEHSEIADRIRAAVGAEVEVVSDRLRPAATPARSALLAAVDAARPGARTFGSPTTSDWVFLRGTDAVKLGPGDSRLSHTAEERIDLAEVTEAARLYADIAKEFLR